MTRSPSVRQRPSRSKLQRVARAPTRRRISRLDAGMIGVSSTAASRIASAASNSTCVRRSACAGSLASAHGAVAAMNSLARVDQPERRRRALVQREAIHRRAVVARRPMLADPRELIVAAGARRDASAAVTVRHRRHAADEIAEVVREIDVVALVVPLPREVAVAAERDLLHQIQPQRIGAEAGRPPRSDRRSCRATCSSAGRSSVMKPWPNTCRGSGRLGAHQHRRPDDGVEARDVLADHVQVGRPPLLEQRRIGAEADRRRVVDQRVEPDVDDARRIERQRDAPRLPGAADRDVLRPPSSSRRISLRRTSGCEELRMRGEMVEQRLLILRQPEEVVLLADPLAASASGAAGSCRRRGPSPA